jgi:hypothetical protein
MTKVFEPRIYVFGEAPVPKLEDFFGKENLECINLNSIDDLEDPHADALWKVSRNPYASFVYSDYMHLTIVKKFDQATLTFLLLSGIKDRVFRMDSPADAAKLEAMSAIMGYRNDLDFATDDLYQSLGGILDAAKEAFDDETSSSLEERIGRINDQKETFDQIVSQSLDEAIGEYEIIIQ